jgi:hypothetical protein
MKDDEEYGLRDGIEFFIKDEHQRADRKWRP